MTDESIFSEALAIADPAARRAYLERVCAGQPGLRQQVDELLAAHADSNLLDRPAVDLARTGAYVPAEEARESLAKVGDRIGAYKLLEKIGEGGMGDVWVADQLQPIKRRVALKLIKPGMDSRNVLGRFEAERQALAVMDHPNIAKVLDAGTSSDGRPYFVMELVKGTPITDFCDTRKLTTRQRLELFVPVCQAIQHAHMKGIIHRDIKPSNVLVELHDDRPVVKVIDFGVAKAIGQQLTEKTIYTGFGALVGTPTYMAPEQAAFNALDVDTRADAYALGVLLYELLVGSPPIETTRLKKAALDEVLRLVREEEAPKPSQRLSTTEARASVAAVRGTEPAKLSALLQGEIDWIVLKALEKDRTRRYETANGFAADVQRYLAGEQVQAVPPSLGYRLRKAYRRNKGAVLVVGVFLGTLLAGIAGTTWQAFRASAQAALAEQKSAQAFEQEQRARIAALQADTNQREAEEFLCRGLLRPIGFRSADDQFDQAEINSFVDMSKLPSDRLRLLCVREALRDPANGLRLARRADRVMQALVGADASRRERARVIVRAVQHDPNADPHQKLAACWFDLALGTTGTDWAPAFEASVALQARTYRGERAIDWDIFLTPTLLFQLDEHRRSVLIAALANQMLDRKMTFPPYDAFRALKLVVPHMTAPERAKFGERLVSGSEAANSQTVTAMVGEFLPFLTPPLDEGTADRLARSILAQVKNSDGDKRADYNWTESRLWVLAGIASRLSPPVADELAQYVLTRYMREPMKNRERSSTRSLQCLAATSPRNTLKVRQQIIQMLLQYFTSNDRYNLISYSPEFARIAEAIETDLDSATAFKLLYDLTIRNSLLPYSDESRMATPRLIHALVRRMDPNDTRPQVQAFWLRLVEWYALGRAAGTYTISWKEDDRQSVRWISQRIPESIATKLCEQYAADFRTNPKEKHSLEAIAFLASKLEPTVAGKLADDLRPALATIDIRDVDDLCATCRELHARLPAQQNRSGQLATWNLLKPRLADCVKEWDTYYLNQGMIALVSGLLPKERADLLHAIIDESLKRLNAALVSKNDQVVTVCVQELALVAPLLDSATADILASEMRLAIRRHEQAKTLIWKLSILVQNATSSAKRAQLEQVVEKIRTVTKPTNDLSRDLLNALEACVTGLDGRTDAALLREAYQVALRFRDIVPVGNSQQNCLATLRRITTSMEPADREPRQRELAQMNLDRLAQTTHADYAYADEGIFKAMTNPRDLEKFLDHPGCVWRVRKMILEHLAQLLDTEYRTRLAVGMAVAHSCPLLGAFTWNDVLAPTRPRFVTIAEYQDWRKGMSP